MKSYHRLGLITALIAMILDQGSKWYILSTLIMPLQAVEVTSFLNLVFVWNEGVSFGLFPADSIFQVWGLIALTLGLIVLIFIWLWQCKTYPSSLGFGLILGGALGNLIDRFRFGAVIDFLDFYAFEYHFYTFNIADSAISIGVALILLEQTWEFFHQR